MIQLNVSAKQVLEDNGNVPMRLIRYDETRMYFFNNMYFMGIQAGIQAAHSLARLSHKYLNPVANNECLEKVLRKYFSTDETIVLLNAGDQRGLEYVRENLSLLSKDIHLPHSHFNESQEAANGTLTSLSAILTETIYDKYIKSISNLVMKSLLGSEENYDKLKAFNSYDVLTKLESVYKNYHKDEEGFVFHNLSKLKKGCIKVIKENGYEQSILNCKKVLDLNELVFLPNSLGTIYILKKEDIYLSNMLSKFRLFGG